MIAADDDPFSNARCLFYGVGAQKSGTTWISEMLWKSPEVAMPACKEVQFWNYFEIGVAPEWAIQTSERFMSLPLKTRLRLLARPRSRQRSMMREAPRWRAIFDDTGKSRDRYVALLRARRTRDRSVGEISPIYATLKSETFAEMAGLSSRSRFFFVMRDPVERCVSGLSMSLWSGLRNSEQEKPDFAALLKQGIQWDLARSDYRHTIEALRAVVPEDRLHFTFYEHLFDRRAFDRLTDFLQVSPVPIEPRKRVHKSPELAFRLTDEDRSTLREMLDPTYHYIAEQFGSDAPSSWAW